MLPECRLLSATRALLGQEAAANGEGEGEFEEDGFSIRETVSGGVSRFSQRTSQAPDRLANSLLDLGLKQPKDEKKQRDREKRERDREEEERDSLHQITWSKAQLHATLAGIFSFGYNRAARLKGRYPSLASRPVEMVRELVSHKCPLLAS